MIEVEVKAHVKGFNDIISKLDQIGATKSDTEHQIDTYFNNLMLRDFQKTDEALRIRNTTINNERSMIILTYKGAKIDSTSKTRKEIEVEITEANNMSSILENLGFNKVADVEKMRVSYLLDEYIITLDEVNDVGKFVEIEKDVREDQDFEDTLHEIFSLYKKLGIHDGFERRSYLELMGIYKNL